MSARFLWSRPKATPGFSLVEMLVVVAVIGILLAILLPALWGSKNKAKRVQCLSNVKQWGSAIHIFLDDNHDKFPYEGWFDEAINVGKNVRAWYNVIPPIAKLQPLMDMYAAQDYPMPNDHSIFACPSVRSEPATPTFERPFFMYGFNSRLDPNDKPGQETAFRLSQVGRPSETVMFTENSENNYPSTTGLHAPARHSKRANLAFVDGHAEAVREAQFRRTKNEDTRSDLEWRLARDVYWYPFSGAPE